MPENKTYTEEIVLKLIQKMWTDNTLHDMFSKKLTKQNGEVASPRDILEAFKIRHAKDI